MRVHNSAPCTAKQVPANDRFVSQVPTRSSSQTAPLRASGIAGLALTAGLSLWRAAERLYNEMRSRHAMEQMLELDDGVLRDMGITRGDVQRAMHLPIGANAGKALADASLRSRSV